MRSQQARSKQITTPQTHTHLYTHRRHTHAHTFPTRTSTNGKLRRQLQWLQFNNFRSQFSFMSGKYFKVKNIIWVLAVPSTTIHLFLIHSLSLSLAVSLSPYVLVPSWSKNFNNASAYCQIFDWKEEYHIGYIFLKSFNYWHTTIPYYTSVQWDKLCSCIIYISDLTDPVLSFQIPFSTYLLSCFPVFLYLALVTLYSTLKRSLKSWLLIFNVFSGLAEV